VAVLPIRVHEPLPQRSAVVTAALAGGVIDARRLVFVVRHLPHPPNLDGLDRQAVHDLPNIRVAFLADVFTFGRFGQQYVAGAAEGAMAAGSVFDVR